LQGNKLEKDGKYRETGQERMKRKIEIRRKVRQ
jgi:hypothetical protein